MKNKKTIITRVQALGFYLLIALILISEIAVAVFFVPGHFQSILVKRQEIIQETANVKGIEAAITAVSRVDRNLLDRYLKNSTAAIPDEKKTAGIVTGLSSMASSSGVIVRSLELTPGLVSSASARSPVVAGAGLKFVPAALTLTADFPSLSRFLAQLRSTSQILSVRDLQFDAVGERSRVQMGVQIYYLPPREKPVDWTGLASLTPPEVDILEKLPGTDFFILGPETR